MKQSLLQEKYPVFSLEVGKKETSFNSVSTIIDYLKRCIDSHKSARFIAVFDHYTHTRSLPEGQVAKEILDAGNIVFCFGITLPNPQVMAVRPRSIGVVELADSFIVTFMEAPMPVANAAMERWAKSLLNQPAASDGEGRGQPPKSVGDYRPRPETPSLSGLSTATDESYSPATGTD